MKMRPTLLIHRENGIEGRAVHDVARKWDVISRNGPPEKASEVVMKARRQSNQAPCSGAFSSNIWRTLGGTDDDTHQKKPRMLAIHSKKTHQLLPCSLVRIHGAPSERMKSGAQNHPRANGNKQMDIPSCRRIVLLLWWFLLCLGLMGDIISVGPRSRTIVVRKSS